MGISLMAANLLINGFKNKDFTGWEQFAPYDDGSLCTMMTLSTDAEEDNISSVIVNKREDEGYVFILNIEHTDPRLGPGHSCLIRDVMIYDVRGVQRLGVSIGRGQSLIADIINRPAMQNQQRPASDSPGEEPSEDECGEEPPEDASEDGPDEDCPEEDEAPPEPVPMTRKERRAEKKRLKKERKALIKQAKMSKPPRGGMRMSKHGRQ